MLNRAIIIGNMGRDPEIRTMQNGDSVANLHIATSERWKDKQTGEQKERTEWHRVSIFNPGLVKLCQNYLAKGSKVYIEGQLQTREWTDQQGVKKYSTEIVLRPYKGELLMLDSKDRPAQQEQPQEQPQDDFEDEIPFAFIMPLAASVLTILTAGGVV